MIVCHMIADTESELHAMADRIGEARKWYQGDHYDIALSKRSRALDFGAVAITQPRLACMVLNRVRGLPLGTPESAEQIAAERRGKIVECNGSEAARPKPLICLIISLPSHGVGVTGSIPVAPTMK